MSRLPLLKWLLMFYQWAWQHPVSDAADQINIDRQTAIDVYEWLREVCSQSLIQTRIVLVGPGTVVQVDDTNPRLALYLLLSLNLRMKLQKKKNVTDTII